MPTKLQDLKRATQVVRVLHKHGLGVVLRKAGLSWHLNILDRHRMTSQLPPDLPERLRLVMEELGGAYVKLGQLLSIRPDLVPPEYCEEFSKLQDNIKPESFEAIEEAIKQELRRPINKVFTHIDKRPLGSASIAQVHKARLKSGKAVVVKVQRPNVKELFSEDMDILRYLAVKIDPHIPGVNLTQIVEEFQNYTNKELNFHNEEHNIELLKEAEKETPEVVIPKAYPAYTTRKLLVMDYLDGVKISTIKDKKTRTEIAKKLVDANLTHVFETGIFHADLHPGNILYLRNHKIGLLDYGIVGTVTKDTIDLGIRLYVAVTSKDSERVSDLILKYGTATKETDLTQFKTDIGYEIAQWGPHEKITQLLYKLFLLCGKHGVVLPKDTVLLGKSLVTAEGTARGLDPEFDFITYGHSKLKEILKKKRTPKKLVEEFVERSKEISETIASLPKESLELIRTIKRGKAVIEIDDTKFRHLGHDMSASSNRISYALIAASSILAGSQLHNVPPFLRGYSLPVLVMYLLATTFIILLVLSIFKEER